MQHIELKKKSKLIISKELLAQISYYHHKVGKLEWSGLVFYKIESGDINKPEELVLKAERLYFMDIGSYSYTEFSPDETILDFYEKYPETKTMKWGLIHTHQSFSAYFSGVDIDELKENAGAHAFYLSLIVNFMDGGNFCAKVGLIVEAEVETEVKYKFNHGLDFFGLFSNIPKKKEVQKQLMSIDCEIEYELDDFDKERFASIKATKDAEAAAAAKRAKHWPSGKGQQQFNFTSKGDEPYIPKTAKELEAFLVKAITMSNTCEDTIKQALDDLEKEAEAYGESFDAVYWDSFEFSLRSAYWATFAETLLTEHESMFYRQCILFLDKYRLNNYSFYDQLINTLDMFVDVDAPKEKDKKAHVLGLGMPKANKKGGKHGK